jgi:hypothetical protein
MFEVWKDIPGYEGYYQASTTGTIRSVGRWVKVGEGRRYLPGRMLKQHKDPKGYYRVSLCKDGKSKVFKAHRLIALTFIPNPKNYPMINHKDEVPCHNWVHNIEWCDAAYNNSYGTAKQRQSAKLRGRPLYHFRGEKNFMYGKHICRGDHPYARKVAQMDMDGNIIKIHGCLIDAGESVGVTGGSIAHVCKGRMATCRGYKWAYLDEVQEKVNSGTY